MTKCLLLLPTNYNNGQPVESAKLETVLAGWILSSGAIQ